MEEVQGRSVGSLLNELLDRLDADVQAIYGADGLNYRPRFTPVMRVLDEQGPSSIAAIARLAPLTHSAASQTVAQMVKTGLVTTRRGKDGRERVVELSADGKTVMPRLRQHWANTARALRQLDEEIGTSLADALERALQALSRKSLRERVQPLGPRPTPL